MSEPFILLAMFFCHVVDDFYLQGILASMKQRDWWKANAPDAMYEKDYLWALIVHSFSWSFMIMLPLFIASSFQIGGAEVVILILNAIIHAKVDDLKANAKNINLWIDQLIHCVQVLWTFTLFF